MEYAGKDPDPRDGTGGTHIYDIFYDVQDLLEYARIFGKRARPAGGRAVGREARIFIVYSTMCRSMMEYARIR